MHIRGEHMRVRVRNKKIFGLWCCVFLLIVLNLFFAINKRLEGSGTSNKQASITGSQIALAADKDGSISFAESKYFKKYVIDCKSDASQIKWQESKDSIIIVLKKSDISKLNLKAENEVENNHIYYDDSKDNLQIKIKKNFNENNSIYIDSNDRKKIIVLIAKEEKPFHHTLVLDAGHGGEDKGTNFGSVYEKDITLKIANYAAEELKFNGFKVIKTRDKDELIELQEISNIANAAGADAFISVHINSNKVSKYKGVTTYYFDPNGHQKDERIKLANTVQKELVKSDKWEDRGIAREDYSVLRETDIPCVLLECGFLSNSEDKDKLLKDQVLKNFAVNIAKGMLNYYSLK
jgi:N-acetylmuramoyl-L-alanine amidase